MKAGSMGLAAWSRIMLAVAGISGGAFAQTASDLGEGLRAEPTATSGITAIKWWGKDRRTYFLQTNPTLDPATWAYAPVVEGGAEALCSYSLQTTAQRMFVRLVYTDQPFTGSAAASDADADGLPNELEVSEGFGTNPFSQDSDGDGQFDGDEYANGSDPTSAQPGSGGDVERLPPEPAISLATHSKWVSNDWNKAADGAPPPSAWAKLEWTDYGGPPWSQDYNEFVPRYETKWDALIYPQNADTLFTNASQSLQAFATHKLGVNTNGTTSGKVTRRSQRPALRITHAVWEDVPWTLSRRLLHYQCGEVDGVAVDFDKVSFREFNIPPDKRCTPLSQRQELIREVSENTKLYEALVEPTLYLTGSTDAALAFDQLTHGAKGPERWIMLPQGEARQVQLAASAPVGKLIYLAQGGGVQPATRVPVQGGSSTISFSSTSLGTDGYLKMGLAKDLNPASPGFFAQEESADPGVPQHAARFLVLPPKLLTVFIHRIQRGGVPLAQETDLAALQTFLNSIFKVQANIEVEVKTRTEQPPPVSDVSVAFDVGLGLENGMGGDPFINDNQLDILVGQPPDQNRMSAEEAAIIAASPPRAGGVNVYLVASQGVLTVHEWRQGTNPADDNRDDLVSRPYRGWASGALRLDNQNIAWVASDTDSDLDVNKEKWMIAHEIGHVLDLGHTQDPRKLEKTTFAEVEYPGFVRNSDSESRLMTGRFGPKSRSSPKRMVKGDWTEIHKSPLLENP